MIQSSHFHFSQKLSQIKEHFNYGAQETTSYSIWKLTFMQDIKILTFLTKKLINSDYVDPYELSNVITHLPICIAPHEKILVAVKRCSFMKL